MDLQEKSYDLKHGPDTARPLLQALATPQSAAAVSAYLARQNLQAGDILVDRELQSRALNFLNFLS